MTSALLTATSNMPARELAVPIMLYHVPANLTDTQDIPRPLSINQRQQFPDCQSRTFVLSERSEIEKVFDRLAKRWKEETSGYSSVAGMVMHPAYLEVISYGEQMIPLILKDLQIKPSHWFIALKTLAKTSPVRPEDAGNIKKMTEAWIAWGKANGKLS